MQCGFETNQDNCTYMIDGPGVGQVPEIIIQRKAIPKIDSINCLGADVSTHLRWAQSAQDGRPQTRRSHVVDRLNVLCSFGKMFSC